ncbi:MAG: hypothetical protein ABI723_01970 [Bacteroidia bacterium]
MQPLSQKELNKYKQFVSISSQRGLAPSKMLAPASSTLCRSGESNSAFDISTHVKENTIIITPVTAGSGIYFARIVSNNTIQDNLKFSINKN